MIYSAAMRSNRPKKKSSGPPAYWDKHDHWHWVPGGKKEKWHYNPGDTIRTYGPAVVKTGAVAVFIYVAIKILEGAAILAF
jgi:hypothetical protein